MSNLLILQLIKRDFRAHRQIVRQDKKEDTAEHDKERKS